MICPAGANTSARTRQAKMRQGNNPCTQPRPESALWYQSRRPRRLAEIGPEDTEIDGVNDAVAVQVCIRVGGAQARAQDALIDSKANLFFLIFCSLALPVRARLRSFFVQGYD